MATTTNYGWTTPDDTALVKDGASAIRSLGTAIDTTVFNNANAAIAKTIVDAKGDIIAATAADTVSKLAVGANDTVLTADSSTATGLKWAAASTPTPNYQIINTGGTALTGATTITVSGISGKNELFILVDGASSANDSANITLRLNSDSGNNYGYANVQRLSTTSADSDGNSVSNSSFTVATLTSSNNTSIIIAYIHIFGCNAAGYKIAHINSYAAGTNSRAIAGMGAYKGTSTISSISLISSSGNFDAGTLYVYGA